MITAIIFIIVATVIIGIIFGIAGVEPPKKQNKYAKVNNNTTEDFEREYYRLRNKNNEWSKEHSLSIDGRQRAKALEKEGLLLEAIKVYEECVQQGTESKRMTVYMYAHDIERLFILYRKTKQTDKEIGFMRAMIKKHPEYNNIEKWRERLNKLTNK